MDRMNRIPIPIPSILSILSMILVGGAGQAVHNRQAQAGGAKRAGVDDVAAGRVKLAESGEEVAGYLVKMVLAAERRHPCAAGQIGQVGRVLVGEEQAG